MPGDHEREIVQHALIGEYEVLREIGRGAMGIVFQARNRRLDRVVAVKVLALHLAHDASFVRRFLSEARAGARLNHPNIVAVFSVGELGGIYYIEMEYLEGRTLRRLIDSGPLRAEQAVSIFRQTLTGLQHAHDRKIVHRDVKPDNLIVQPDGRLVITDFGIARVLGEQRITQVSQVAGTPLYMSPEQVRGEELDGRSDLFSLGVVLYEMLTGDRPFRTPPELLCTSDDQISERVRSCSSNGSVPPALVPILESLLRLQRDDRCADGATCLKDLEVLGLAEGNRESDTAIKRSHDRQELQHLGGASLTHRARARTQRPLWLGLGAATILLIGLGILVWRVWPEKTIEQEMNLPMVQTEDLRLWVQPAGLDTAAAPPITDNDQSDTVRVQDTLNIWYASPIQRMLLIVLELSPTQQITVMHMTNGFELAATGNINKKRPIYDKGSGERKTFSCGEPGPGKIIGIAFAVSDSAAIMPYVAQAVEQVKAAGPAATFSDSTEPSNHDIAQLLGKAIAERSPASHVGIRDYIAVADPIGR